jgi:ABC-type transport system involved in cytochrome c biogenesis permease subunit
MLAAITCFVLVALGVLLILFGAWMTVQRWDKAREGELKTRKDALGSSVNSLTKLLEAIKYYPAGQRFIVLGIVLLVIGGACFYFQLAIK